LGILKKMGMGILPFRAWGFEDLHVQTLGIWGFNDPCRWSFEKKVWGRRGEEII
jgi:hypothetical protein